MRRATVYSVVALVVVVATVVAGSWLSAHGAADCVNAREARQLATHSGARDGWSAAAVRRFTDARPVQLGDAGVRTLGYRTCLREDHQLIVGHYSGGHLLGLSTRSTMGEPFDSDD